MVIKAKIKRASSANLKCGAIIKPFRRLAAKRIEISHCAKCQNDFANPDWPANRHPMDLLKWKMPTHILVPLVAPRLGDRFTAKVAQIFPPHNRDANLAAMDKLTKGQRRNNVQAV